MEDRDHDLLIEIRTDLKNIMAAHLKHETEDTARFLIQDTKIVGLQKGYWIGYGIMVAILFALRYFFKV